MHIERVCVLGGTGFIGRHLCAELDRRGYRVKVLSRRPERHRDLLVLPRVELVHANIHLVSELSAELAGCQAVVNLVGILHEGGRATFQSVHAELPAKVNEACEYNRIRRLLHMSALGASPEGPSEYLKTKAAGEETAHAAAGAGVAVTSFRPSVVFGPEDRFFNRFAALLRMIPFVFPLAKPHALLQPVYVRDVSVAFANALTAHATWGQRLDLAGPWVYRLEELVRYTARIIGVRRHILHLSDELAELQARILERLPGKLLTRDNLRSLEKPNTTNDNALPRLGIHPSAVEAVVPTYLGPRQRAVWLQRLRALARRAWAPPPSESL